MDTITATRDTWIKRLPEQSTRLSASEKEFVKEGKTFNVVSFRPFKGGHWEILREGDSRPAFIFDAAKHGSASHWDCSWEKDDEKEEEAKPSQPFIARAQAAQTEESPVVGAEFGPESPFDTRITPHFTYGEVCKYQEARRFAYQDQCLTAFELLKFLEVVRAFYGGRSTRITSGHRPTKINRAVGGVPYSEHLFRAPWVGAIDYYVEGVSIWEVEKYASSKWPHSYGYGAQKGFGHLGMRGLPPRRIRWPY